MGKQIEFFEKTLFSKLSASTPAGEYIRYETVFDELKESRRELIDGLISGGLSNDVKSTCSRFREQITNSLTKKSKDFVLVFWLIEATTIFELFKGVEASAKFLVEFLKVYWNVAHPIEDGNELKMSSVQWFDKEFSNTLKFLNLYGNGNEYGKTFSKNDIDRLNFRLNSWKNTPNRTMTRNQKAKYAEFKADWDNYRIFCSALSEKKISEDLLCLNNSLNNFKVAEELIASFAPGSPPAFHETFATIRSIEKILSKDIDNLKNSLISADDVQENPKMEEDSQLEGQSEAVKTNVELEIPAKSKVEVYLNGLQDKQHVYEFISILVNKLEELDPNSPNVQLGKKMLKIKDMNFLDILEELVDDEKVRDQVIRFFGIDNTG